jgi:hypothetical protein
MSGLPDVGLGLTALRANTAVGASSTPAVMFAVAYAPSLPLKSTALTYLITFGFAAALSLQEAAHVTRTMRPWSYFTSTIDVMSGSRTI